MKTIVAFSLSALFVYTSAVFASDDLIRGIISDATVHDQRIVISKTSPAYEIENCRDFSLSDAQILEFFKRATKFTSGELHHGFEWAPCQIEGHLTFKGNSYWFEINAAGTGSIETASSNFINFGCVEICKSIFDYGYDVSGNADAH